MICLIQVHAYTTEKRNTTRKLIFTYMEIFFFLMLGKCNIKGGIYVYLYTTTR